MLGHAICRLVSIVDCVLRTQHRKYFSLFVAHMFNEGKDTYIKSLVLSLEFLQFTCIELLFADFTFPDLNFMHMQSSNQSVWLVYIYKYVPSWCKFIRIATKRTSECIVNFAVCWIFVFIFFFPLCENNGRISQTHTRWKNHKVVRQNWVYGQDSKTCDKLTKTNACDCML